MTLTQLIHGHKNAPEYPTLVAAGTTFEGTLETRVGIRIDGILLGSLYSSDPVASIYIGTSGKIEGNVHGTHIMIAGTVLGDIHCEGLLELKAGAHVLGNISYHSLNIEPLAKITGMLTYLTHDTTLAAVGDTAETRDLLEALSH